MEATDDSTIFGQDQDEYEAFFSAEAQPAARSSKEAVDKPSDASQDIESEYAMLSPRLKGDGSPPTQKQHDDQGISSPPAPASVATFALDDSDDDNNGTEHQEEDYFWQDFRPPELPAPPADFSEEDLALRESLSEFYLHYNPENIASINVIVEKYRGRGVADLWVQLGVKYGLPAVDVVERLSRTLYLTVNFEHPDEAQASELSAELRKLRASLPVGVLESGPGEEELIQHSLSQAMSSGSDSLFRMLCLRGLGVESELRPKAWKVLLGYLPITQHAEWDSVLAGKRALYTSYRDRFLMLTRSHKLEVKVEGHRVTEALDVLQQIQKDVDRTRQDVEVFARPSTRSTLSALLFVYAQLNPTVRYVQGMNEIAAVLFHVMLADPEFAEADTFWCFSQIMEEIKAGFIQELDNSSEGSQALVSSVERLLRIYEPALAAHLQKCGNPQAMFFFRWCTLLFAQDSSLADAVQLWDYFLADPKHCGEAVSHFALAIVLSSREELLQAGELTIDQVLRAAPCHRDLSMQLLLRWSWSICALEHRTRAPAFPVRTAKQLAGELSGWAQATAARARVAGEQVTRTVRQNIAPVVKEKAEHASGVAAVAAQEKAQAMQSWLEESAPGRREALEKAQTKLTSLWQTVRSTTATAGVAAAGAAASAAASSGVNTQRFISECSQSEKVENAKAKISSVAGSAASTSSKVITRFFETI